MRCSTIVFKEGVDGTGVDSDVAGIESTRTTDHSPQTTDDKRAVRVRLD
jgi:hypothetical protein